MKKILLYTIIFFLSLSLFLFAAILATLDFESGADPPTDWSSVSETNGGNIDSHVNAMYAGTRGSRHYVPVPGVTDRRAYGIYTAGSGQAEWYVLFYLKISDLTIASGDSFYLFYTEDAPAVFRLDLSYDGSNYTLTGAAMAGSNTNITKPDWHKIECYCKRETGDGANDGIIRWWVDDALIHNETTQGGNFDKAWQNFHFGFRVGLEDGTREYIYIDEIEIHDSMPEEVYIPKVIIIREEEAK